jgi:guanylate kinase
VLRNRLVRRGTDSREAIERRMKIAEEEISHWREYKYMVVNDDLAEAYDNLRDPACRAPSHPRHRGLIRWARESCWA